MEASIFAKMRLKKGTFGRHFYAPESYLDMIRNQDIVDFQTHGKVQYLHLFVESKLELQTRLPEILPWIDQDTKVWISWKKSDKMHAYDINRDSLNAMVVTENLKPYVNISLDETWSALGYKKAT